MLRCILVSRRGPGMPPTCPSLRGFQSAAMCQNISSSHYVDRFSIFGAISLWCARRSIDRLTGWPRYGGRAPCDIAFGKPEPVDFYHTVSDDGAIIADINADTHQRGLQLLLPHLPVHLPAYYPLVRLYSSATATQALAFGPRLSPGRALSRPG